MKTMKGILGLALIAAIVSPAFGLTFSQQYAGQVKFKFQNWDVGRIYLPQSGNQQLVSVGDSFTLTGADLASAKATSDVNGGSFYSIGGSATYGSEDAWGLFRMQELIGKDPVTGQFNISLWDVDDPSDDVVGIFYGIEDIQIEIELVDATPGNEIYQQTIWAAGDVTVDLYEVPDGSANLQAAAARTALDQYPNWATGDDNDKWLSATAIAGVPAIVSGGPAGTKFFGQVRVGVGGAIVNDVLTPGTARMTLDIDPTIGSGLEWESDTERDIDFLTNVFNNTTNFPDWTTNTDDPAFANYSPIPEPMTMAACGMAFAGLGGYIRRRRRN